MAYKPLRMDKIEQIWTYHRKGVPKKKIARLLGVSKNTVKKYIERLALHGSTIEDENIRVSELRRQPGRQEAERDEVLQAKMPRIIKELGRVGVTRYLLWEEYKQANQDGFSYSRFCRKVSAYKARQDVTIRQDHKAAYRLSIDYAGKKIPWVDRQTGEVNYAEVLVCTMPYSAYTFACAVGSQKQSDFISGINQALLYIGGLPKVLQSDNLKSLVKKADRYEPTFTELCTQLSSYYGIELEATRVGKPKDKASVERHVALVYSKLYAPLRDVTFYSLDQINKAFSVQLEKFNKTNFQAKDHSRYDLFARDEKPHLADLPSSMFEVKKSTRAKVQRNYHVILGEDWHQYSVPYQYVGKQTEITYTSRQVEIYCNTERIAVHKRDRRPHAYSTLPIHMPEKHLRYLEQKGWDETYFKRQAEKIGPHTLWAITSILESKTLIEQTYNACLGLLRLERTYSGKRLEAACARAHTTHRVNYGIIKNIMKKNMDQAPDYEPNDLFNLPQHENVRGPQNYY
jgi:transposase